MQAFVAAPAELTVGAVSLERRMSQIDLVARNAARQSVGEPPRTARTRRAKGENVVAGPRVAIIVPKRRTPRSCASRAPILGAYLLHGRLRRSRHDTALAQRNLEANG